MFLLFLNLDYDQQIFISDIYNRLNSKMFSIALTILKNNSQAEDALSITFVKIIENIEKISKLNSNEIDPYCVKILKNEIINILRKENKYLYKENMEDFSIVDLKSSLEEDTISKIDREELKEIIKNLRQDEKLILELKFLDKLSYKEIAGILEISESASKMRMKRLLEKLKNIYIRRGRNGF